jgi:hypothetical protein
MAASGIGAMTVRIQSFRLLFRLLAMMAALMAGIRHRGASLRISSSTRSLVGIDRSYALGQGGLSAQPMITDRIEQIEQLHPQTIHIFLQEYFNIYPARHQYHWESFDKTLEAIRATSATPVVSLFSSPRCFSQRLIRIWSPDQLAGMGRRDLSPGETRQR